MSDAKVTDILYKEIQAVREDIRELRSEIQQLNSFRWRIVGGTTILSVVASVLTSLFAVFGIGSK